MDGWGSKETITRSLATSPPKRTYIWSRVLSYQLAISQNTCKLVTCREEGLLISPSLYLNAIPLLQLGIQLQTPCIWGLFPRTPGSPRALQETQGSNTPGPTPVDVRGFFQGQGHCPVGLSRLRDGAVQVGPRSLRRCDRLEPVERGPVAGPRAAIDPRCGWYGSCHLPQSVSTLSPQATKSWSY